MIQYSLLSSDEESPKKRCPLCPEGQQWHPATTEYFARNNTRKQGGLFWCCKSCLSKTRKAKAAQRPGEYYQERHQRQKERESQLPPEEQGRRRQLRKEAVSRSIGKHEKQPGVLCGNCRTHPVQTGYLECEACRDASNRSYIKHRETKNTWEKRTREALRREVFDAYGGECTCCGESHVEFLAIDHVYNDGNEHRKVVGSGVRMYRWLRKSGYPQDGRFQVLCNNCNYAKYVYGICPHQREAS